MANEFAHITTGIQLDQAEYEGITAHQFNAQATGDIMCASSATQLTRLAIGTANQPLTVSGGLPQWGGDLAMGGSTFYVQVTRMVANATIASTVDNSNIQMRGGTATAGSGAFLTLASKNAGASTFTVATSNVAGNADITRVSITGNLATAVATWTNVTHTGLELSGNLAGATRSILNVSHSTVLASTGWAATTDDHWAYLQGGTFSNGGGAKLMLYGKNHASNGAAIIQTPDAAETANTTRITFAGDADIARIQIEAGAVLNVGTALHGTAVEGDVRILGHKLNVYLAGAWEVVTSA